MLLRNADLDRAWSQSALDFLPQKWVNILGISWERLQMTAG